jgi:hypothetical protein|tara:strand:+ start:250 stop:468 length:219 start_codon:yes stop_codon:yes gene_type:complete
MTKKTNDKNATESSSAPNAGYVAVYVYWDTTELLCFGFDEEKTLELGRTLAKKDRLTKWNRCVETRRVLIAT